MIWCHELRTKSGGITPFRAAYDPDYTQEIVPLAESTLCEIVAPEHRGLSLGKNSTKGTLRGAEGSGEAPIHEDQRDDKSSSSADSSSSSSSSTQTASGIPQPANTQAQVQTNSRSEQQKATGAKLPAMPTQTVFVDGDSESSAQVHFADQASG